MSTFLDRSNTRERDEKILSMWNDGTSSGLIAALMLVSSGAVLGVVTRGVRDGLAERRHADPHFFDRRRGMRAIEQYRRVRAQVSGREMAR